MTLEAVTSNELPTILICDTISATHHPPPSSTASLLYGDAGTEDELGLLGFTGEAVSTSMAMQGAFVAPDSSRPGRRKRRRRPRSCKSKEEAESQRMTHIAVERNRRRQMNEHLAVLRSIMPDSYVQKGDQASIVGGAIDFVKELEQLLQSLEAQKRTLLQEKKKKSGQEMHCIESIEGDNNDCTDMPPFAQFFAYPQYMWCHVPRDFAALPPESHQTPVADIEVTIFETHANLRILSPRRPRQLLKMVAGLQSLGLTVLHLNVTTLDSMVLYSLSAKMEEACSLTTVDDIATAVHHMLSLIEAQMNAQS